jgi:hypothetical protein
MSDTAQALLALAILVLFVALYLHIRRQGAAFSERWLPDDLHGAELAFAEKKFVSMRLGLVARLDRAYRGADDVLHLVELKTRDHDRAYTSDVIELSVQRLAYFPQVEKPIWREFPPPTGRRETPETGRASRVSS